jgi:hypothetical protein
MQQYAVCNNYKSQYVDGVRSFLCKSNKQCTAGNSSTGAEEVIAVSDALMMIIAQGYQRNYTILFQDNTTSAVQLENNGQTSSGK